MTLKHHALEMKLRRLHLRLQESHLLRISSVKGRGVTLRRQQMKVVERYPWSQTALIVLIFSLLLRKSSLYFGLYKFNYFEIVFRKKTENIYTQITLNKL
jgi:hypothetical protein